MDNLVYLLYGQAGHDDELVYSVLSALQLIGPESSDYRMIVYTDHPAALGELPVRIERLSEQVLVEWAGPFDFNHRRKIFVIKDALDKFGGRLILCDADTFFVKHPKKAFARVRPGQTVMHIGEYHLYDPCARKLADFLQVHDLRNRAGHRWNLTLATAMFNAGIIGLHESDISLLDEVVHLTDQVYPHLRIPTIEQFAFSVCFQHYTKLRQSYDVVHHYWPPARRALFREQLSRVLHDCSIPSYEEQLRELLPHRPSLKVRPFQWGRPSLSRSLKPWIRRLLTRAAERAGAKDKLKRTAPRIGRT